MCKRLSSCCKEAFGGSLVPNHHLLLSPTYSSKADESCMHGSLLGGQHDGRGGGRGWSCRRGWSQAVCPARGQAGAGAARGGMPWRCPCVPGPHVHNATLLHGQAGMHGREVGSWQLLVFASVGETSLGEHVALMPVLMMVMRAGG
eukprot:1160829-Pelagomonas_calceolata.AAC.7